VWHASGPSPHLASPAAPALPDLPAALVEVAAGMNTAMAVAVERAHGAYTVTKSRLVGLR
jgi:hypothetical protein